jgi:hypothetical protein
MHTCDVRALVLLHPAKPKVPTCAVQVTGIFGSSMEVYICVDGESPGSGPAAGGAPGDSNGSHHGADAAPGVFHCGSAFATVSYAVHSCSVSMCQQPILMSVGSQHDQG